MTDAKPRQMRSLAAALGWCTEIRTLVFRHTELLQHLWPGSTGHVPTRSFRRGQTCC